MGSEVSRTGGDLLVDVLRQLETDVAFGVVSVHNLPLVDAIARDLRWVPTRGEAGAVNAADGWSRVSGRVGCAVTSTGTGAGNAAGALVEALTAATPMLHVTGQIEREHLGADGVKGVIHETRDQPAMLAAISTHAVTIGDDPAADFAAAIEAATTHPRGPASLEWPVDAQFATVDLRAQSGATTGSRHRLLQGDVERAVELIGAAERPVVWAGGGALRCDGLLGDLLDRIGAGLFTSNAGRGALPESDSRVIGNFASSPGGAELLAEADLLISLGTHFRSNETRSYGLALPATHVQVDVDPAAIGRAYPATVGVVGEIAAALEALLESLPSRDVDNDWTRRCRVARLQVRDQLRQDIGPYAELAATIDDVLGRHDPRVRDITIPNSAWGNRLIEIADPRTNVYPRGGGIGQALGLALGAAIARPQRSTMAIIGDGGLQVQLGELATIAEEQVPVTIVVFDDQGYGVLRNMQDAHLGRRSGVDLLTPSIPDLASAFDIPCLPARSGDEFKTGFTAAADSDVPTIVHVDCGQLGPMPRPFVPPVHIPEPS